MVGEPEAILFDLDGTLVDTVETRIEAWSRAFIETGISPDRKQLAKLIGSDGRRLARVVLESAGATVDDERAESLDRRSGEIFDELNQHPRPLKGVAEVIAALDREKLPWAIATSSRRDQVSKSVAALGLAYEPRIVDGTHVAHAKPAPDLLLLGARELHVDPSKTWYVGDSVWDMQAARAAGMTAVGVATGAVDEADLRAAGADLAVRGMAELLPVLGT